MCQQWRMGGSLPRSVTDTGPRSRRCAERQGAGCAAHVEQQRLGRLSASQAEQVREGLIATLITIRSSSASCPSCSPCVSHCCTRASCSTSATVSGELLRSRLLTRGGSPPWPGANTESMSGRCWRERRRSGSPSRRCRMRRCGASTTSRARCARSSLPWPTSTNPSVPCCSRYYYSRSVVPTLLLTHTHSVHRRTLTKRRQR